MKIALFLLALATILIGSITSAPAQVRYGNGMSQFGSSTVRAFLPLTTLFTDVAGGSLTSYVNITSPHWYVFTASYQHNVVSLSLPYLVENDKHYSAFTFQTVGNQLLNKVVADECNNPNTDKALLRTINLVQYNFPVNVYNFSNNAPLFADVQYAEASAYTEVPVGDYIVYWTSAAISKRGILGSNISGDPYLYGGKTYTYWIFPSGSFIVEDCINVAPVKRDVNDQLSVSKLRMRRAANRVNTVQQIIKEGVNENVKVDNLSNENDKQAKSN